MDQENYKGLYLATIEKYESSVAWYAQRHEALSSWARKALTGDLLHGFFSILANGSKAPHEQADWSDSLATHKRNSLYYQSKLAEVGLVIGSKYMELAKGDPVGAVRIMRRELDKA